MSVNSLAFTPPKLIVIGFSEPSLIISTVSAVLNNSIF